MMWNERRGQRLALSALVLIFGYILPTEGKQFDICFNRRSNSSSILDTTAVSTSLSCARLCNENEKCKSANYNKYKSTCELFCDNHSNLTSDVCGSLEVNENTDFLYEDYPCNFYMPFVDQDCQCAEGFQGELCQVPPTDCHGFSALGSRYIYIYPDICHGITVGCFYAWMFIFRSPHGKFTEKANATWQVFKWGFGSILEREQEYWIGNEHLQQHTKQFTYTMQLRVVAPEAGNAVNFYENFAIDDEGNNYTAHYDRWSRQLTGDNQLIDGRQFRTRDHNDDGCVSKYAAAFWYEDNCPYPSPLTGVYSYGGVAENMTNFWALVYRMP